MKRLILAVSFITSTAITSTAIADAPHAPNFTSADHYMQEIRQRERGNAQRWRDWEQRQQTERLTDEVRELRQELETDNNEGD